MENSNATLLLCMALVITGIFRQLSGDDLWAVAGLIAGTIFLATSFILKEIKGEKLI